MATSSPALAAQQEILNMLESPRFIVGYPETLSQLEELHRIDCQAYNHNLTLEEFSTWWNAYPQGSICLLVKGRIVASIGIYPLCANEADLFAAGKMAEGELKPLSTDSTSTWYVSGCVVVPEHQNRGLLRPLLRVGFGGLLSRSLPERVRLLSLGETTLGKKILRRTGFHAIKPASEMPDGDELYERVCSPGQLRQTIQGF